MHNLIVTLKAVVLIMSCMNLIIHNMEFIILSHIFFRIICLYICLSAKSRSWYRCIVMNSNRLIIR